MIDLLGGEPRLSGLFCCILCHKAEENLGHFFFGIVSQAMWSSFLQEFDVSLAGQRTVCGTIEEFLLHLPFRERLFFVVRWGVCCA